MFSCYICTSHRTIFLLHVIINYMIYVYHRLTVRGAMLNVVAMRSASAVAICSARLSSVYLLLFHRICTNAGSDREQQTPTDQTLGRDAATGCTGHHHASCTVCNSYKSAITWGYQRPSLVLPSLLHILLLSLWSFPCHILIHL